MPAARWGAWVGSRGMSETTPLPALHLTGLVKRFSEKTAVAGVDLIVPAGSY